MSSMGLLQNRINELNSAIVNFVDQKVYVTGFYNAKMLELHLERGKDNWSSKGIYDFEEVNFYNTKDNALFIIQKNGETVDKNQFTFLLKQLVQYKNKKTSVTINIRKNRYKEQYNLFTETSSYCFDSKKQLIEFLENEFIKEIQLPDLQE